MNSLQWHQKTIGRKIFCFAAGFFLLAFLNLVSGDLVSSGSARTGPNLFSARYLPLLFASGSEALAADIPMVPASFSELAEKVSPAVVNIRTVKTVKGESRSRGPFGEDDPMKDFFDRFFGPDSSPDFKQRSLGSGFIIDAKGYVVTNDHVVEDADKIKVFLKDEKEYDAEIVGRDVNTDVALIKITSEENFPVARLGNSDVLKVGQWVVAIGNPFGLEHTVTAGIVSAKGRVIGSGPYDDFIQTDASINPGNSGGPLINLQGEVVGINTIIIAGGQGIGFAIPVNLVKEVVNQLKESGEVTRGWLGVSIQDLPSDLADYFEIKDQKGVLVADVVPGDPAEAAGIRPRDIILGINGEKIKDSRNLLKKVAELDVGEIAEVSILRDGKTRVFRVKVAKRDNSKMVARKEPEAIKADLGIQVTDLTAEVAQRLNVVETDGVIVAAVEAQGKAAEAGIHTGDIIVGINRVEITSVKEYERIMGEFKTGDSIAFLLKRPNLGFLVLKLEK
jgi:serine protease Do